jgi:hypothetical protein
MASGDSGKASFSLGSLVGAAFGSLTGPEGASQGAAFGLSVGKALTGIAK